MNNELNSATQPQAVMPGWKLVPVEPTQAMIDAAIACGPHSTKFEYYAAMLAAAPPSPQPVARPHLSDIEHPMQHAFPDEPQPVARSTAAEKAAERVRRYISERAKMRGIHQNDIHCMHTGDVREVELTASDLSAICDALLTRPAAAIAGDLFADATTDNTAVDRFAAAMKAKMARQRARGYGGWDDTERCTDESLAAKLMDHTHKGDPVDVANFCMMLHQRHNGDTHIVGNVLKAAALAFAKRVASAFVPEQATPAIEPVAGLTDAWISVDERLPDECKYVAVLYWPYNNRENRQIVGYAEYVEGEFYTHEGDEHHPPSHWCPLPDFPVHDDLTGNAGATGGSK